jgi:hypothetical protein
MKPKELEKLGFKKCYKGSEITAFELNISNQVSIYVINDISFQQVNFVVTNLDKNTHELVVIDIHTIDDLKNVIESTREIFKPRMKFGITE